MNFPIDIIEKNFWDVDFFLSAGAGYPVVGTIPAIVKVALGIIAAVGALVEMVLISPFIFTKEGQSDFLLDVKVLAYASAAIIMGTIEAIPFVGSAIACVKVRASIDSTANLLNWMIETRGGFAYFLGYQAVPSQHKRLSAEDFDNDIEVLKTKARVERFTLAVDDSNTKIEGIIYYPNGSTNNISRCLLFHNPNLMNLSESLCFLGYQGLVEDYPILVYDYRGTGLSSENSVKSSAIFRPTCSSCVADGEAVLKYALEKFSSVSVMGSSFGGAIATIALQRHLRDHPDDARKTTLINHDSFSTIVKVVVPCDSLASWLGWALGAHLDAKQSIRTLVEKQIPITVLCNRNDSVIPEAARMATFIETLPEKENVALVYGYGKHIDLDDNMVSHLTPKRIFRA